MDRIPARSLAFELCLAAIPALAQEVKVGDPWARSTPKGADFAVDFPVQGIGAAGPTASPKSDDMKRMKM
jgi:hypothetical protein